MFYFITEIVNQKEIECELISSNSIKFIYKMDNDKQKLTSIVIGMETWPIADYSEGVNSEFTFGVYHISLDSEQRRNFVSLKLIHVPDL
jgi:hypothetical protein